jgi:hypothetical protein
MKNKHCEWCDHSFEPNVTYQIYCSPECRESATKEKISEKYKQSRIKKRAGKDRRCKSCNALLSIYNEGSTCLSCDDTDPEVAKAVKIIKGIVNGKEIPE